MGNTGFLKKSSRILSLKCRQAYAFSFKNTRAKEKPKTLLFLDNIQNTDQVGSGPTNRLAPGARSNLDSTESLNVTKFHRYPFPDSARTKELNRTSRD